jgi:putative phosphoribosyl transferase
VDGANPQVVMNEQIVREIRPPAAYIEAETSRQLAEIERRRKIYRGQEPALDITGRTAIVIDDGIATGATMKAVLKALARSKPRKLVLAVPVAPQDSLDDLSGDADEIVCLVTPESFFAVGMYYRDFEQTSDEEVLELLRRSRRSN